MKEGARWVLFYHPTYVPCIYMPDNGLSKAKTCSIRVRTI